MRDGLPSNHEQFTALHVRGSNKDVLDALALASTPWPEEGVLRVRRWVSVAIGQADAQVVAPRLAAVTRRPVVVSTIGSRCELSVVRPDGSGIGPTDGGNLPTTRAIASAVRRTGTKQAAEKAATVLSRTDLPPGERQFEALQALGVTTSPPKVRRAQPGLLVVHTSPSEAMSRLPHLGHGAWVVPRGGDSCLIVPDGSGMLPTPRTLQELFAPGPSVAGSLTVIWGAVPMVLSRSRDEPLAYLVLGRNSTEKDVEQITKRVVQAAGLPDGDGLAAALRNAPDMAGRLAAVLPYIGVHDVSADTSVEELAVWASKQDGSVHVPADGRSVTRMVASVPSAGSARGLDATARLFRRRRLLRRFRTTVGWLEAVAWVLGIYVAFDSPESAVGVGVVIATMIAIRMVTKRLLRRPE